MGFWEESERLLRAGGALGGEGLGGKRKEKKFESESEVAIVVACGVD